MKRGMESFSHYQVAALRMFISFLFFIPFIIRNIKDLKRKYLKSLLLVGFLGNAFPAFLYTTAQTEISSSLAGILNSLTPIFTLILGVLLYREKTRWINISGLIIGLIGAAGLVVKDFSMFFVGNNWYGLFAVVATLMYGFTMNEIKYNLKEIGGVAISALAFLMVGPVCGIYLLTTDFSAVTATPHWELNLFYIGMLAFLSSFIAVIGMNVLLKYTSAIFVASVTYVIPIFAIFWGVFDGEKLNILDFAWMAVVMVGVYLINKKSEKLKVKSEK
jgi:drug/metabolite transporter (DMT)-like permease